VPDPSDLLLSSYDYKLPEERIAQEPIEPRHAARLLMVPAVGAELEQVRHQTVWDWQNELQPGDLLVVNDTRVLRARLRVRRSGGGWAELLVLEPRGQGRWLCLARPGKKFRPGDQVWLEAQEQEPLPLQVLASDAASGGRIVQFPPGCEDAIAIEALLERYGEVPLPPYINRHDEADQTRYQTRYAARPGAVAAPTAGLHLSDPLLAAIRARGVQLATVTLHVGLGTFRPVEMEDLRALTLHSEWVEVASAPERTSGSGDSTRFSLRRGAGAAHQLPPAEKFTPAAGECADRQGAVAAVVRRCDQAALSLLFLWRCHVD